jgi:hypothetical protein
MSQALRAWLTWPYYSQRSHIPTVMTPTRTPTPTRTKTPTVKVLHYRYLPAILR